MLWIVRSVRSAPRLQTRTSEARISVGSAPRLAGAHPSANSHFEPAHVTASLPSGGAYTESDGPSKIVSRQPTPFHSWLSKRTSALPVSITTHTSRSRVLHSRLSLPFSRCTSKPTYFQPALFGVTSISCVTGATSASPTRARARAVRPPPPATSTPPPPAPPTSSHTRARPRSGRPAHG